MAVWAREMFACLNIKVSRSAIPELNRPCLFVGNHISYLDIPLLLYYFPVLFVAKKEIASWPIIGSAARFINTILVDRGNAKSRQLARDHITKKILLEKAKVCTRRNSTDSGNSPCKLFRATALVAREDRLITRGTRGKLVLLNPTKDSSYGNILLRCGLLKLESFAQKVTTVVK